MGMAALYRDCSLNVMFQCVGGSSGPVTLRVEQLAVCRAAAGGSSPHRTPSWRISFEDPPHSVCIHHSHVLTDTHTHARTI